MTKGSSSLKGLLEKETILVGAHSPFIAKLVERAGFGAVYLSGGGLSASMGVTDTGILEMRDFVYTGRHIAQSISIPLLADADTGFGDVAGTVRAYIEAGIAGLHIEDQVFPKKCGHVEGKEVVPLEEMVQRIKVAMETRNKFSKDFVIVARTDARGAANIKESTQLEEAIQRGFAYQEAGADLIFPESLRSREEFQKFREKVSGPLMANMTEFGKTPYLPAREFFDMGYAWVLFPVTLFRCLAGQAVEALQVLKKDGSQKGFVDKMMSRNEIAQILK